MQNHVHVQLSKHRSASFLVFLLLGVLINHLAFAQPQRFYSTDQCPAGYSTTEAAKLTTNSAAMGAWQGRVSAFASEEGSLLLTFSIYSILNNSIYPREVCVLMINWFEIGQPNQINCAHLIQTEN